MNALLETPYNFVPLTKFILRPDWGDQVSHDHPFQDGWCGELEISLTTHTPLCVGGRQDKAGEQHAGRVYFHRDGDDKPSIPGTSLKGMLRNVLEIAAFSHFNQVEERRLGVRDISGSSDISRRGNFYSNEMMRPPPNAGWLNYRDGDWLLTPCKYTRLYQGDLVKHFGLKDAQWTRQMLAADRYKLLGGLREVTFNIEELKSDTSKHGNADHQAYRLGHGEHKGIVVVTGQPGKPYTEPKAKKREFIFFDVAENTITVPPAVMADFEFIHSNSDEWSYWKKRVASVNPGIPVFYKDDGQGGVKSLGLTMMYKLAYTHTLHDAIGHTSGKHLQNTLPDLAQLIFGRLEEDRDGERRSLRGRVNIGLAHCTIEPKLTWQEPTVLNSPKPTYYPTYIKQGSHGLYNNLMEGKAELAGWKRYPVKSTDILPPPDRSGFSVQVELETVPEDTEFRFRLRLHNLRDVELGALCWALDFGGRDELRHSLGTGKPYGLGQISLRVTRADLIPNNPDRVVADDGMMNLLAVRETFVSYMDSVWQTATGNVKARWQESETLTQLLGMADPAAAVDKSLRYMRNPKDFVKAKQKKRRLAPHVPISRKVLQLSRALREPADTPLKLPLLELEQAIRQQEKKCMTPEQRQITDLEDMLKKSEDEGTTTSWNNLSKAVRGLPSEVHTWPEPQKAELAKVLDAAEQLGSAQNKTKIVKAIKQARRKLAGEH